MLDFKKIEKEDIGIVRTFLGKDAVICDHTLGGVYIWRGWFNTHYCVSDGVLFFRVRYTDGLPAFTFVGGDPSVAYLKIKQYCEYSGEPFRLYGITIDVVEKLRERFEELRFDADRDMFDYIYDTAEFTSLTGKKWNGQRNHINRFKRSYPNYAVVKIESDEDISRTREFFAFLRKTRLKGFPGAFEELERIDEAMTLFNELGLCGAYITVDGAVIAASLGEVIGDTLFIHVEKAMTEYSGVYPMMANSFARLFGEGTKYTNREEDEGDEGLRKSKLSYHPVILREKYVTK